MMEMKVVENNMNMTILMAEDDPDHQFLIKEAFITAQSPHELIIVEDGEELLDYLYCRNKYVNAVRPNIIFLDLNMPRKNGMETLEEIKGSTELQNIPIVILTCSQDERDIIKSYRLGIKLFVTKPAKFEDYIDIVKWLDQYWAEIKNFPPGTDFNSHFFIEEQNFG